MKARNRLNRKMSLAFVLVLEAGKLERQAELLVESIRRFAGLDKDSSIWAIQPRGGKLPSQRTLDVLMKFDVNFMRANLNVISSRATEPDLKRYGFLNKAYAAAFVESFLVGQVETLVLSDTDTLVLHPPEELVLSDHEAVAIRPVDRTNVGSPADQPVDAYWSKLYEVCGVDPRQVWNVETTTDLNNIRAYFNGGCVAAKPERRLFSLWKENLERFIQYEFDPAVCSREKQRFHIDQTTLAATLLANTSRGEVRLLSKGYNYPLHKQSQLPEKYRAASLAEIVSVHYHNLFHYSKWWDTIEVPEPYRSWLNEHLPLPSPKSRHQAVKRIYKGVTKLIRWVKASN